MPLVSLRHEMYALSSSPSRRSRRLEHRLQTGVQALGCEVVIITIGTCDGNTFKGLCFHFRFCFLYGFTFDRTRGGKDAGRMPLFSVSSELPVPKMSEMAQSSHHLAGTWDRTGIRAHRCRLLRRLRFA